MPPNILSRTMARAFAEKAIPPSRPPGRLTSGGSVERYNVPDPTRHERQANLYANLAWMQIAVSAVATAVASTPFQVMRRGRDELQQISDHPLEMLFEQPNDDQDQTEFFEATVAWKLITGNCYWWLNRLNENTPPDEIWIIPSNLIQPVPDGQMSIRGYLYDTGEGGTPMPLQPWEIVHFKTFNPLNRYVGLSAVQALAMDATGDIAAQQFNTNFYGRDNIKASGILAFADYVEEGAWRRLEADWKEQYGGGKNRVMRLRGVGAGGVQWLQTQLTQVEIQYLEQRRFTMEEVYARIAPGLASILAINATEANSTAGKDTFWSMAVYPQTFAIGKKITQKLLPAYGDGLVGQFEDVRRVDTQIELLEQAEYSKTHTIKEVRAKYYGDKPIGDGRDLLLPAEVGSGLTDARTPEERQQQAMEIMQARAAVSPPQNTNTPADALQQAGKALDRRRWREKAIKALAAGKAAADVTFDPDYLSDGEAMTIRAALKRAATADDVWRVLE